MIKATLKILAGTLAGAALGYAVQCSGGMCRIMATPWRGALAGAVIAGLLVARHRVAQDRKAYQKKRH